jgi:hypothetical protein
MSLPFDDNTLDELAKTNPDLVAQYRAKMQAPNDAVQSAKDNQAYGDVASSVASGLNALGNAKRAPDVILGNRMDQLGKAPTISSTPERGFDSGAIDKATKQGLEQAKESQTQAANTFNEEQKLTDTQRGRDWQDKSQAQTQKGWAREDATFDPDSPESAAAREYIKKVAPNAGSMPGFDRMTAAQAMKVAPGLLSAANLKETVAQRRDTAAARQAEVNQRDDFHRQDAADRATDRQTRVDQAASDKATASQAKVYRDTKATLETARGNPAMAQAEKDIYASDKADSLANMYGDPNKLSKPQVQLLASEIGKIASGGVSSQHELESITPDSLSGRMSVIVSKLTNEPTPANAAAFVKQYQDYTKALRGDAQKVINDKYGRVIETSKKDLSDDQYNDLKDNYLNRFEPKQAAGLHGKDLP